MRKAPGLPSRTPDHPLWSTISCYDFGPSDAALSFAGRLARENGWRSAHAVRVIEEYRRFCFLAVTAGHPVTPSDAVDQAWHLHLTYTRDYWQRFCPMLGRDLHHQPTEGGPAEHARFFAQYAQTLHSYEAAFGTPPGDIWPSARRRLVDDPQARRVHRRDALVLPIPVAWGFALVAIVAAVVLAST